MYCAKKFDMQESGGILLDIGCNDKKHLASKCILCLKIGFSDLKKKVISEESPQFRPPTFFKSMIIVSLSLKGPRKTLVTHPKVTHIVISI